MTRSLPEELNNNFDYGFSSFTAQPNYETTYMTSPNCWTSGINSSKLGLRVFEKKSTLAN